MAKTPSSEQVQVNFRMPSDLKARIEVAAEQNSRSTTAEIVATLEEKYPSPLPYDPVLGFHIGAFKSMSRNDQERFIAELARGALLEQVISAFESEYGERPTG